MFSLQKTAYSLPVENQPLFPSRSEGIAIKMIARSMVKVEQAVLPNGLPGGPVA
jgi:hypothetical protein